MKQRHQNTLFNVALVALANEVGAQSAVDIFFQTLEDKVRLEDANSIIKDFFNEENLNSGEYDSLLQRFANEDELRKLITDRVQKLKESSRIR